LVYKDDDYEAPCSIETLKLMYHLLSPLEKTLIGAKTLGWSNRKIAKRLNISKTEIGDIIKKLYKKMKELFKMDPVIFYSLYNSNNIKKFKLEHKQLFGRCIHEKKHIKVFI